MTHADVIQDEQIVDIPMIKNVYIYNTHEKKSFNGIKTGHVRWAEENASSCDVGIYLCCV